MLAGAEETRAQQWHSEETEKELAPLFEGNSSGSIEESRAAAAATPVDVRRIEDELVREAPEVVIQEDGFEEEVPVKLAKSPEMPSPEEVARHEVSHVPYKSWCRSFVMGRGKSAAHRRVDAEENTGFQRSCTTTAPCDEMMSR